MRDAWSVPQVRAQEAAAMKGLPAGALMQRAAAGLETICVEHLPVSYGARVVVLAGSGDNGGDALFAGARLAGRGARVDVLATGNLHPAGARALTSAGGRCFLAGGEADAELLAAADLVIDGLVGIGGSGALREPAARLAGLLSECRAPVVAVDIPSGVEAGTGAVAGSAVRATTTVTFGTYKPGLFVQPGADFAGDVIMVDIGLNQEGVEPALQAFDGADVAGLLPWPGREASKYSRGVLGVVAGSDTYPGAAVLVVAGAVRAGCGMVRFAGPEHPAAQVRRAHPEALVTQLSDGPLDLAGIGRVQAWVAGPGMGTGSAAADRLAAVLATDVPVLVDADGLSLLAGSPAFNAALVRRRQVGLPTLLTPHLGEFERLTGRSAKAVARDVLGAVRQASADLQATVLLKGARTVIGDAAGGPLRVNTTGTSWLATAGSGDVLAGICGSLLAAGLSAPDAAAAGAWLHGAAAEAADGPLAAPDIAAGVPSVIAELLA
jgi:hydroxyethylthiazole kinase-like uncharacterized protein yjeF